MLIKCRFLFKDRLNSDIEKTQIHFYGSEKVSQMLDLADPETYSGIHLHFKNNVYNELFTNQHILKKKNHDHILHQLFLTKVRKYESDTN